MLDPLDCSLTVIDVQGKLAQLMYDKESLFKNVGILIQAAKILDIPILWCQQVPDALGLTLPEIAELLSGCEPINKSSFSCYGSEEYCSALRATSRRQAILCGMETHVCVYQTAMDLLGDNYGVTVIADAVSSRTAENKRIALDRMSREGVKISSTEMVLFELMKTAEHPKFRQVARLIK